MHRNARGTFSGGSPILLISSQQLQVPHLIISSL